MSQNDRSEVRVFKCCSCVAAAAVWLECGIVEGLLQECGNLEPVRQELGKMIAAWQ